MCVGVGSARACEGDVTGESPPPPSLTTLSTARSSLLNDHSKALSQKLCARKKGTRKYSQRSVVALYLSSLLFSQHTWSDFVAGSLRCVPRCSVAERNLGSQVGEGSARASLQQVRVDVRVALVRVVPLLKTHALPVDATRAIWLVIQCASLKRVSAWMG